MTISTILSRLDRVTGSNGKYRARCPAHGSSGATLSIKDAGDGKTLVHCFAGCSAQEVMEAIDMRVSDLYPDDDYQRPVMTAAEQMKARLYVEMAKNKRGKTDAEREQAMKYAQQLKQLEAG